MVKELLGKGASVDAQDGIGLTPLHTAIKEDSRTY